MPAAAACLLFALGSAGAVREAQGWAERQERRRLVAEALLAEVAVLFSDFRSKSSDRDRALQICNDVLDADDTNAMAYAVRGRVHRLSKAYILAAADCTRALEIDPDNFLALRTCAFVNYINGRYEAAGPMYEQALSTYRFTDDLPRDFHNRACLRRHDGEYLAAMEDHNRAVALNPDYGITRKGRGATRYMLGDVDGAIDDLERAASLPGNRGIQCHLWIWEMRRLRDLPGDREAAAQAFAKAELAARRDPVTEGLLAVLRGQREADDYIGSLEASDRTQSSYYLGAKALIEGRKKEAAEYFKIAATFRGRVDDEQDLAQWHLRQLPQK
jgi:tetratricopeptide (TPR) repeat protein